MCFVAAHQNKQLLIYIGRGAHSQQPDRRALIGGETQALLQPPFYLDVMGT